ncbi:calcium-binding protein [Chachezhania antarctica]|uniref:calcium-binding protein n=1 Tax=Chachezhania antarctica TaxID=2340860 RepID=UPI0013CEDC36|nr:calcium-binding protein [Chachezhania antarctica]
MSDSLFGVNFLFHADRAEIGSDYHQVMGRTGTEVLRFPGGTITEQFFDPSDPDADIGRDIVAIKHGESRVETRTVESLSDFLAFCETEDYAATVVLPTYRYFDQKSGRLQAGAEAEIKGFVRKLVAGEYGSADIHSIELGNEWYQDKFRWSVEEFADVQAQVAVWVREAINGVDRGSDIRILAQAGRNDDDNAILARAIKDMKAGVDGVITHLYGVHGGGDLFGIGYGLDKRLDTISDVWKAVLDRNVPISVTEWNVGESGPQTSVINGLERTVPLMRMFAEMVENDVDMAAIWTGQNISPAALSTVEGQGTALTPTGYFYHMLSTALPGTALQVSAGGPQVQDAKGHDVAYQYNFTSKDKAVIYVTSGSGGRLDIDLDVSAYAKRAHHVSVTYLEAKPGSKADAYDAEARMRVDEDVEIGRNGRLDLKLDAFETAEVTLTFTGGILLRGDPENGMADLFRGTRFDDDLRGGAGADTLFGNGGADRLDGGAGHDRIVGGGGRDVIAPGAGDDIVIGGDGKDTISYRDAGGGVNVYLSSGHAETDGGTDTLIGIENVEGSQVSDRLFGDGANVLEGLGGDDFIWVAGTRGNLADGGAGDDVIDARSGGGVLLGGAGQDQILGGTDDVQAYGGGGADWIIGGSGNDFIEGGRGSDHLAGGAGRDVFHFALGDGNDVIADFEIARDRLSFDLGGNTIANARVSGQGDNTVLKIADLEILFEGVNPNGFDLDDLLV